MTSACRACGTQLPLLAQECSACGAPVAAPRPASAPTLPPGQPPPVSPAANPSGATVLPGASAGTIIGDVSGQPAPAAPRPGDTGPLSPGQSFGRRYHIKRMLGLGGMGAVYQAWDTELGVDVAIKLIRPEIIANPGVAAEIQRRFKRELLLARLVSHANVVRIHDLGEIDGIKYITMSYVDGTDLATILQREGALPVRRALSITRRVCEGLIAAHAAGVVHRDLKPANIMVGPGDAALITDFGIARLTTDRAADTRELDADAPPRPVAGLDARFAAMTRLGSMVGTVEYMPPEQARGVPVDERADVYALGLILYDMLSGGARFDVASSVAADLEARSAAPPRSVRDWAPHVPAELAAIVARCVEPDPQQRFQSAAELLAALARLDDEGVRLPIQRTVGLPRALGIGATAIALIAGLFWYFRPPPAPVEHDPVSIVIADFRNTLGDPSFDRAIEPVMKLSLESADFVTAYARSDVRRGLGVTPPDVFDARAATELAVKQGLGIVVAGSIERAGSRLRLSVTASRPVSGEIVREARATARDKDGVLAAAAELSAEIREALGDQSVADATQRQAIDTLTATSLDVVREYATAIDGLANSRFEEARASFERAIALDPQFGLALAGLSIASSNLGNQQDAQRYAREAMRHVDRMTERERFRTRGLYYYVSADYAACVREYGALVARFKVDTSARNNLALCATRLRDMKLALEQMREAVKLLPNRPIYRVNLALYSAYAGDFAAAEARALEARELSPFGYVPLGFAQVALGRLDDARTTLREFAGVSALGASHAAAALGDLAIYEGRYAEAVTTLQQGAAADLGQQQPDRAAAKLAAIAFAELARGRKPAAVAAARRALEHSQTIRTRFLAGLLFARAGQAAAARGLAERLRGELQAEPRAYARIIQGELDLVAGDLPRAITALGEANGLLDTWIGRLTLGRAYLAAGAYPQADSEFDRCATRRGEALALFLDEEPTYGFYPEVEYYQGRVREGLGTADYRESYRRYLAIRGAAGEDPLLADVRRRAAGQ
jgi:tetratricopeptide (TPR) repeat protein/tRNA A-37 threonylcarbamoyl transferase component Bud32